MDIKSISDAVLFASAALTIKDARWVCKNRKRGTKDQTLYKLREMGLLEHMAADQWYLTDAGRYMVKCA